MKTKQIIIGAIVVVALGAFAYNYQAYQAKEKAIATEVSKTQQIADLQTKMSNIKDQESGEYKDVQREYCDLVSRPEAERQKAIVNVREFLHGMFPAVSKEFTVTYDCNRGATEYYESDGWSFLVDSVNNNIVEMGQGQRKSKNETNPVYDYTPRYNAEQVAEVAERFIKDHQAILGVDISKMTRQYEGTKDGGDGIHPGNEVNYFYTWRTKDNNGKTTELVAVTITRGGQIVVFDNDTYDLKKSGN